MKGYQWLGAFFAIWAAVAGNAQQRGGTEVELRQGELARWSAWWVPGAQTEGRFWWQPEKGGNAWLRVGPLQVGALKEGSGSESRVAWGPGTRQSDAWGLALSGELGGLWALQNLDTFEVGAQAALGGPSATLGAGGRRTWSLDPKNGSPRWTDTGFVGVTAKAETEGWGTWSLGGKGEWRWPEIGVAGSDFRSRISVSEGGWGAEVRGGLSNEGQWSGRGRVSWKTRGWGWVASWEPAGSTLGASAEVRGFDLVFGAETEARTHPKPGLSGGVSLQGRAGVGRWKLAWSAEPEGPVQAVSARWTEPQLEASIDYRVEGFRLGWFGPGITLAMKLRFLV